MSNYKDVKADWLEADGLILLESWARDGYTIDEIATRIGISKETLYKWMREEAEIKKAINTGRELVDYKVENALLKSALGYKTKEVKVTTLMRGGRVIETTKETVNKEMAPNVTACQVWLYNRMPKKWKNMNRVGITDELDEDTSIHITVERAQPQNAPDGEDAEWQQEVNSGITLRKAKPGEEQAKSTSDGVEPEETKPKRGASKKQSVKSGPKSSKHAKQDVDYWPDDWEDEV